MGAALVGGGTPGWENYCCGMSKCKPVCLKRMGVQGSVTEYCYNR